MKDLQCSYCFIKMRHTKSTTMNLYQKQALKPIQQKYSPNYKKTRQTPHIQVILKSTQLNHAISKVKVQLQKQEAQNRLKQSPLYASLPFSQKRSSLAGGNFARFNSTNLRRESLQSRNLAVRSPRQQHEFLYKKGKTAVERLRTQQKQLVRQQIQHKRKELQRDKELKIKRQTSERSFVLETHKQTIDMMKRSRQIRSRSEIKLVKEKYKETEKEHQFLVKSQKKAYLQLKQEHQYHKNFIKNKSLPKFHYPNLADTLAIASKTITTNSKPSHSKVAHSQTTTKKGLSNQKLQPLKEQPRKMSIVKDQLEKQTPQAETFITAEEALDNPQINPAQINHPLSPDNPQNKNQTSNIYPNVQANELLQPLPSQNPQHMQEQDPKVVE